MTSSYIAIRSLLLLSIIALITACGSSSNDAESQSNITVRPSLGLIRGALVELRDINGNLLPGNVAIGFLNNNGAVTLQVDASYTDPILVNVLGSANAEYFDEASNKFVPFPAGKKLRAYLPEPRSEVGVTTLTELAAQKIQGTPTKESINAANQKIQQKLAPELGASGDILTPPAPFSDTTKAGDLGDDPAGLYAARLAALAKLSTGSSDDKALQVLDTLKQDIKDGTIDGNANGSPISSPAYDGANFAVTLKNAVDNIRNDFGNDALKAEAIPDVNVEGFNKPASGGSGSQFTVGGQIKGLFDKAKFELRNGNGDLIAVLPNQGNGAFTFQPGQAQGVFYKVVAPDNCTVVNGEGSIAQANISNVAITCTTVVPEHQVQGSIVGVDITGQWELKSGGKFVNDGKLESNPFVTFGSVKQGSDYEITTSNSNCSVENGKGTVTGLITNVKITCTKGTASPTEGWNRDDKGITLLEKAAGTYDVYVWQTTNKNIPIGDMSFTFAKAGIEGKVTDSTGTINITTSEGAGTGDIRGDLTDVTGEGFLFVATSYRFVFGLANGRDATFVTTIHDNGSIEGTYSDSDGEIKFTNTLRENVGTQAPPALKNLAGTYRALGYFFVQGPFEYSISDAGTIQYTDPASCTVKSIEWDGNGDRLEDDGDIQVLDPSSGHRISLTKITTGYEFRIGGTGSTNIYRLESKVSDTPTTPLLGTFGLSVCKARPNDQTPPEITVPADISVAVTDASGSPRTKEINAFLKQASATDKLTAEYEESVNVTNDAPNKFPVGETVVTFTATDKQGNTANKSAKVTVTFTDITKPEITLPTNLLRVAAVDASGTLATDSAIQNYINGVKATDNADGDIQVTFLNRKDKYPLGNNKLDFSATDKAGNKTVLSGFILVEDQTAPVITLMGSNPQKLTIGNDYTELGATATDNVDAANLLNITIDATAINKQQQGDYLVTYNVKDRAGNAAQQVTRTVTVVPEKALSVSLVSQLTNSDLTDVIFNGSQFLAVGKAGTVLVSSDGKDWSKQATNLNSDLNAICWDGVKYWVTTQAGTIGSSTDGASWELKDTPKDGNFSIVFTSIACSEKGLVAVTGGGDNNLMYGSSDGATTWQPSGVGRGITNPIWNPDSKQFIAARKVFQPRVFSSADTSTWKEEPDTGSYAHILWDGAKYVLLNRSGVSTSGVSTSTDFSSVTSVSSARGLSGLHYTGSLYLSTNRQISTDLSTWSSVDTKISPTKFASGKGEIVAIGANGGIVSSKNGTDWVVRSGPLTNSGLNASANSGVSNITVAVGDAGTIFRSTDLKNWQAQVSGTDKDLYSVTWDGTQFIAVGKTGTVISSSDGTTWAAMSLGATPDLLAISSDGANKLVIGAKQGFSSQIWSSADAGQSWTKTADFTESKGVYYFSIIRGKNDAFLVSNGYRIKSSSDGVTWSDLGEVPRRMVFRSITWDGTKYWNSIASFNNTQTGAKIQNSIDAITWADVGDAPKGGNTTHLNKQLIWDASQSQFLVIYRKSNENTTSIPQFALSTSADGANWVDRGPDKADLNHLLQIGNKFLMVGEAGSILIAQ